MNTLETEITYTDIDGAIVNEATGEVIGYQGQPFVEATTEPEGIKEAVLWATERRARAEAALKAKEYERDTLIAGIKERFDSHIKAQVNRIAWIDTVYGAAMREFARAELEGGKSKSVNLPWATLGFRASKGKVEVEDAGTAAYTLVMAGYDKAVRLTIDMGLLEDEVSRAGDNSAVGMLYSTLLSCAEVSGGANVASVEFPQGVSATIQASEVPNEIPDGVKGVSRVAPEDPLGNFYVKHGRGVQV